MATPRSPGQVPSRMKSLHAAVTTATPATPQPAAALPAKLAAPDLAAFELLDVPVAWADGFAALLGANAAFVATTGHPLACSVGQPLACLLGLPAGALAGLADSGPQPLAGRRADGRPLNGKISLRRLGHLQVVCLHAITGPDGTAQDSIGRTGSTAGSTPGSTPDTAPDTAPDPSAGAGSTPAPAAALSGEALLDHVRRLGQIGVWQRDLRSGTGVWDANTWRFWGLAPSAAVPGVPSVDRTLLQLHPDDRAEAATVLRQSYLAPGCYAHRLRVQAPGAALRHVRMVWEVLPGADGKPAQALGIMVDDTAVHALSQRLDMAAAATGVGVWSLQLDGTDGTHWDAQMRALHGLAPDAPLPDLAGYLAGCVHPDDRSSVADALDTLKQRRDGLLDLDFRVLLPGGVVRRLATRSAVSGAVGQRHLHGVMLDVTERHHTDSRLRQAQERALLAARGAGIGTWESDPEAKVGCWDAQMFHLRGRPPRAEPVLADERTAWLHPDDRASQAQRMDAAVRAGVSLTNEFRVVWPDGTVRWLASSSSPVRDALGCTVSRVGINWDVTDAHNAAAAQQQQLLARHESQAKSRFLARISHELRTPLNAVLGFSQLLLAEGAEADPATWRRRVQHVLASGEHLLALIDDVLELSSLESGELPLSLQPVALANLVQTSLPLVELLAADHGVSLHLGTLDGWALADPVRLRQVLLNLLSNAIKYNRPGGQVSVSAELLDGWLRLRVQDTGRGLDAEQISHLFEPFNRLGADSEGIAGTGIGLAIVQASVRHMGGTLQVHSQPGQGSCFEVSLQAAANPQPAGNSRATLMPQPLPAAGGHLLYIEDNEVNLLIVSELIKAHSDIRFSAAVDGASGLAAAQALQPDLILLDMQLPDMDGHAVLRQLRANPATAGIRCIALSANAMPDDIRNARCNGFDDYWTKPLDLKAFMRALDRLFGTAAQA